MITDCLWTAVKRILIKAWQAVLEKLKNPIKAFSFQEKKKLASFAWEEVRNRKMFAIFARGREKQIEQHMAGSWCEKAGIKTN